LKGATLGDAEVDVDDTLKWLKRSKKREKELAKKRQQELENMDKMYQEEYSESACSPSLWNEPNADTFFGRGPRRPEG
jgi:hypothetical protein